MFVHLYVNILSKRFYYRIFYVAFDERNDERSKEPIQLAYKMFLVLHRSTTSSKTSHLSTTSIYIFCCLLPDIIRITINILCVLWQTFSHGSIHVNVSMVVKTNQTFKNLHSCTPFGSIRRCYKLQYNCMCVNVKCIKMDESKYPLWYEIWKTGVFICIL
jgi:hypothetical protein